MESLSLSKLNLYIRRVISLNFQEPIWVLAEILSIKEKAGHVYLELTEKDDEKNIAAQNAAIIWKSSYLTLKQSAKANLDHVLRAGNEVRLLVAVDYSVKYGLKLIVQGIDPEYTFGKLAQTRILTIEKLKAEKVWQQNKSCALPIAIKNIAVIGSKESAGYKDFENHLKENQFGYTYNVFLYSVSVQGMNSVSEICNSFVQIGRHTHKFDLIVLIRGGGSKHDLIEFDSYEIAKEISISKIPVVTGIGHFVDESVADLSAFEALKTPTAVADYILEVNRSFELEILKLKEFILQISMQIVYYLTNLVNTCNSEMASNIKILAFVHYKALTEINYFINNKATLSNHEEYKKILDFNFILESNDPKVILQKGYSLTYKENKLLTKCELLKEGDEIKTIYSNGILMSKVNKIWE